MSVGTMKPRPRPRGSFPTHVRLEAKQYSVEVSNLGRRSSHFLHFKSRRSETTRRPSKDMDRCLSGYFKDLQNALLECTNPTSSKREKSDLSIWQEVFSVYESNSIFCATRECSCLHTDFTLIQTRYETFHSSITAKNYVCLR
jgi:hypothetical protein